LELLRYDRRRSYQWNYDHAPRSGDLSIGTELSVPKVPGTWQFCGLSTGSPLGVPAGPLLNGPWCLYYAALGFDVLTYKTVRSFARPCYPLPNLQPVSCRQLRGKEKMLPAVESMDGSWAVSFGMPSQSPEIWRADLEETRRRLPAGKVLIASVVGAAQAGDDLQQLAEDYAQCANWAVASGVDGVEINLSCPNVATRDGQLYQQPGPARQVAQCVRSAIGDVPLLAKVGAIASREDAVALVGAVDGVANAICATNSIAATVAGVDGKELFEGQRRGICGDAIRQSSIAQVALLAEIIIERKARLDLVGVGGASTAGHVRAYLAAGAHAVQIATAAMIDPTIAIRIKEDLADDCLAPPALHST
ncbi:MAG: hypothetical protein AAF961_09080, partial [Planctomycetota bacterium]